MTAPAPIASMTERPTSFQVAEGQAELLPGGTLLIVAYALVWAMVFALVALVYRRQTSTDRRLRALEDSLQSRERAALDLPRHGST